MITGGKVNLRDKKLSDARKDYKWQTDPELVQLDAAPLVTAHFSQYLLDYSLQLRHLTSTMRLFAVETLDGEHIGNCTYYGVDETSGEVEVGIMIGDRNYWDKGYGTDAVVALANYIFLDMNLKRIHLKTLDWNKRARKCFQKCGFMPCGNINRDGHRFVVMELRREWWRGYQDKQGDGVEKSE